MSFPITFPVLQGLAGHLRVSSLIFDDEITRWYSNNYSLYLEDGIQITVHYI